MVICELLSLGAKLVGGGGEGKENEDARTDLVRFPFLVCVLAFVFVFSESASTLEEESGYVLEVAPIGEFKAAILGGRWDEALGLLEATGLKGSRWEVVSPFLSFRSPLVFLFRARQRERDKYVGR